jgi:hypothetical protein
MDRAELSSLVGCETPWFTGQSGTSGKIKPQSANWDVWELFIFTLVGCAGGAIGAVGDSAQPDVPHSSLFFQRSSSMAVNVFWFAAAGPHRRHPINSKAAVC